MKRILLIGPAPQNIGGISIYIRRLMFLLKDEYIFDIVDEGQRRYCGIFNLRSFDLITYFTKLVRADLVHINSGNFILRAFQIIVCKFILKKHTVVTVHRDPRREGKLRITRLLLSKCNTVVMVNQEGYDAVYTTSKDKYFMIPAFLPPILEEEPKLPDVVYNWITEARKTGKAVVLASNASKIAINKGTDLYGLDLCIDAMIELHKKNDKLYYLIFVIADNSEQKELIQTYKHKIDEYKLTPFVLLWEQPLSFVRLIQKSDIILRTTNTDGDAISVREALFCGKKVIASDIITRPQGTNLFKNRDVKDLVKVIGDTSTRNETTIYKQTDYINLYKKIYH